MRPVLLSALAVALSACGHMPVSTMWAQRNFDAGTAAEIVEDHRQFA
jgi:hypothetical protein